MSIGLRLVLFYYNYISDMRDYSDDMSPAQIRIENKEHLKKVGFLVDCAPIAMAKVEDRKIPMRDGTEITIRIYHPNTTEGLPIVVFFHGGGFVLRDIDSHDKACRRLAKTSNVIVVSVGYRLAPEFKFPIPIQDAYDARLWVAENATTLGGDPEQLIVMGDSAGGNLATVTAIQARELGKPKIAKQVLIYPSLDARMQLPSMEALGEGYFLSKHTIRWFIEHYKSQEADIVNPLMSPLLTEDLSNLPPAFVITASHDPLKDDGEHYADRLIESANEVYFKEYHGTIHGFLNLTRLTRKTQKMHDDIRDFIAEGTISAF